MSVSATEQGSLSTSKPAELVSRWHQEKVSGLFRVECALGIGFAWLNDGEVIDCRIGNLSGEPAFLCLLGLQSGEFALQAGQVERKPTLKSSTLELLSVYTAQASTWQHLAGTLPPLNSVLVLNRDKVAEQGAALSPEDKALLRLIDMRRRVSELVEESGAAPISTLSRTAYFLKRGFARLAGSDAPEPAAEPAEMGPIKIHGVRVISEPPAMAPDGADASRANQTVPGFPQVTTEPPRVVTGQRADVGFAAVTARVDSDAPPQSAREIVTTGEERLYIGRYEILSRLGRGGMGTVYLARVTGEGGFSRLFALKVLRSHLAKDKLAAKSLLAEAKIASRLNHANVVGVVDVGTHGEQPYVVMDYVHGLSLAELLSHPPEASSPERVIPILLDALAGLGAVHAATDADGTPLRVIHHDVSPHNFLVGVDGVCRLTDFGIACLSGEDGKPMDRGKPAYLSPERVENGPIDPRSDIFSMGVLMWTALTGARLFETADVEQTLRNVSRAKVPAPSSIGGSPACFDAICLKALMRDPSQRYQTAEEMLLDLRRTAASGGYLGSPADVAAWVRGVMGDVADIVFDGPDQVKKFAETAARREKRGGAPTTGSIRRETTSLAAGHTVPLPRGGATGGLNTAQWVAVFLAIGGLLMVVFLPENAFGPDDQGAINRARRSGHEEQPSQEDPPHASADLNPRQRAAASPSGLVEAEGSALGQNPAAVPNDESPGPAVTPVSNATRRVAADPNQAQSTPPRRALQKKPAPKPVKPAAPAPQTAPALPEVDPGIPEQRIPIPEDPLKPTLPPNESGQGVQPPPENDPGAIPPHILQKRE